MEASKCFRAFGTNSFRDGIRRQRERCSGETQQRDVHREIAADLPHGVKDETQRADVVQPTKSIKIGGLIQESGYLLSYNSEYLRRRNWIQICLMGECAKEKVVSMLNALNRACFRRRTTKTEKQIEGTLQS